MMSMQDKLKRFRDLLVPLHDDVFHYERPGGYSGRRYIVWKEEGENSDFHADNRHSEQVISATVDLYTRVEFDALADDIQEAFNESEMVSWQLVSVEYEGEGNGDTGYIHFSWDVEVK